MVVWGSHCNISCRAMYGLGLYLLLDLLRKRVSIVYVTLATIIACIVLLGRSTSRSALCLSASVCVFLSVFVDLSVCVTLVFVSLLPLLLSVAAMLALCYSLRSHSGNIENKIKHRIDFKINMHLKFVFLSSGLTMVIDSIFWRRYL